MGGAEGVELTGAARAWRGRTQGVLTPRADAVLRGLFMRPSSLREFSLRAHPTVHELAAWGDHRTRCVVMVDFLSDYLIVRCPKSRHGDRKWARERQPVKRQAVPGTPAGRLRAR